MLVRSISRVLLPVLLCRCAALVAVVVIVVVVMVATVVAVGVGGLFVVPVVGTEVFTAAVVIV